MTISGQKRKIFIFLIIFLFLFWGLTKIIFAESYGTAVTVPIAGGAGKAGDIVSFKNGEYQLSNEPYDNQIYGVITDDAVLYLEDINLLESESKLAIWSGESEVNISAINGDIKSGDYITTSVIPGVGQKADISGYVLGVAMEDFSPQSVDEIKKIKVFLDIKSTFIESNIKVNLIEALRSGTSAPFLTPVASFRYILAVLIVAASFAVGFASFGKISGSSVEAMGRNPLASKSIKSAVLFNVILTMGIMLVGLSLAYLILVL